MNNAANELLDYLYENDFCYLPNYPFSKSFDEMTFEEDEETVKRVNEYAKYCLKNKDLIKKMNEEN